MEKKIRIENWEKTLLHGNYYNNYEDEDIEEYIVHSQFIGDFEQYILVQSHIRGDGSDYHNFQIWNYDLDSDDDNKVTLTDLVQDWET